MDTRRLGNSDLDITPVGFGSWAIGGPGWDFGWGPQDDRQSIDAILKALEMGVNWIDTAAVYGTGHSEELVARAVEEWAGPRPYVFTKCGLRWDDEGHVHKSLRAESIRKECEDSLRRLRTDAIDLYQIHWPVDEMAENEEGWRELVRLQEAGKVRWIAVSNWNVEQLQMALDIAPVTSLQPVYSLIKRGIEDEILPFCRRQGIGVIVYSPMGSGLLTGAMTRERLASLPENDWRRTARDFQEPNLTRNLAIAEKLGEIARRHECSPGEVAVAWTLRHPAVTGAIVGARSAEQAAGVMGAARIHLSETEAAELEGV